MLTKSEENQPEPGTRKQDNLSEKKTGPDTLDPTAPPTRQVRSRWMLSEVHRAAGMLRMNQPLGCTPFIVASLRRPCRAGYFNASRLSRVS